VAHSRASGTPLPRPHTIAAPAQTTGHATTQGPAQPGAPQGAADPGTPPPAGARGNQERLLAPAEVGALFGVDPRTVTIWANHGLLTPVRTPGGHRRYRDADVAALLTGTDAATLSPAQIRAVLAPGTATEAPVTTPP
jgi:hypothetical protein